MPLPRVTVLAPHQHSYRLHSPHSHHHITPDSLSLSSAAQSFCRRVQVSLSACSDVTSTCVCVSSIRLTGAAIGDSALLTGKSMRFASLCKERGKREEVRNKCSFLSFLFFSFCLRHLSVCLCHKTHTHQLCFASRRSSSLCIK